MLYDLHAVTDNIGDKFAAWSYYHALLKRPADMHCMA